MPPIRLISFGYLHLPTGPDGSPVPPAAERIEDVRDRLRDPAAARDILDLDGLNPHVQDVVLNTPAASPSDAQAVATEHAASPNSLPAKSATAAARSKSSTCTPICRAYSRRPPSTRSANHDQETTR